MTCRNVLDDQAHDLIVDMNGGTPANGSIAASGLNPLLATNPLHESFGLLFPVFIDTPTIKVELINRGKPLTTTNAKWFPVLTHPTGATKLQRFLVNKENGSDPTMNVIGNVTGNSTV
jgi:hypothetical protein